MIQVFIEARGLTEVRQDLSLAVVARNQPVDLAALTEPRARASRLNDERSIN